MRSVTNWSHQISLKHGSSTGAYHWVRQWEPGTTPLVGDLATRPPDKTWQSSESSWQLHPKSPSCKATLDVKLFNHRRLIWGVLKNGGSPSHHGCLKWPDDLHDVGTLCLKPPCCWRIDCISQSRNSRSPQSKKTVASKVWQQGKLGNFGKTIQTGLPKMDSNWSTLTMQSQGTAMPKDLPTIESWTDPDFGEVWGHCHPNQPLDWSVTQPQKIHGVHGVHRGWSSQVRK